ncbi:unnamed protein product [Caenorhabditis angaria]|uniref:Uncharacterized protein n=1 Tax=Caenorhabditis angaria TaxID=860376 RepID=A0A9P1ITP5_9PELO|nr:unnamed protein product [Caenorhabditis angaria]
MNPRKNNHRTNRAESVQCTTPAQINSKRSTPTVNPFNSQRKLQANSTCSTKTSSQFNMFNANSKPINQSNTSLKHTSESH